MSDKAISAGDLVMIVKLMECGHGFLGFTFIVSDVRKPRTGQLRCVHCGRLTDEPMCAVQSNGRCVELHRLRRIDPPAIDTTTETERELAI